MPPASKRTKQRQLTMLEVNKQQIYSKKILNVRESLYEEFDSWDLKNPQGRSRTVEENKIVLLSLKMMLSFNIELVKSGSMSSHDINWTIIENLVAKQLGLSNKYISELRRALFEDGDVLSFGLDDDVDNNSKEWNTSYGRATLDKEQLQIIVNEVDLQHKDGTTVTNRKIRNWLEDEHSIIISQTAMQ